MSNEPIKYILQWDGIDIGITHNPKDSRHGRPMTAFYGHIRGSYGDAEDGMSIDVYLKPVFNLRSPIFRVKQVRPETGELDEHKYVLGCADAQEATELYLKHMPKRFFGGIEQVKPKLLDPYRTLKKAVTLAGADYRLIDTHLIRIIKIY